MSGESYALGEVELWADTRGEGPDVLMIPGLGDVVEAWEGQFDAFAGRYRLTAFDNRWAGRSSKPESPTTTAAMADDAAALLDAKGIERAHVVGSSMGSAVAQELALRHPGAVRSLVLVGSWARADHYFRHCFEFFRRLGRESADERELLEAFFLWVYSPAAHDDGTVDSILEAALAFPYPQSREGYGHHLDACDGHDTADRLSEIEAPTLVLTGDVDRICPPHLGREVADGIAGAEQVVVAGQGHQPFQEDPAGFNDRVSAFWRERVGG